MKFSESWLRTWTNPKVGTAELVSQLTMAGLEVDGVEPAAASFTGVVVAQITEVSAHPDAEKLRVCQVDLGLDKTGQNETVQIVCGAPNAAVGLKAPCATVGAVLPEEFKIKKAKLRGVESYGMLCGADELGFESKIDGLWELPADAPVGSDLNEWLVLDDQVIEVDLTPNRADCFSIRGIARDIALVNGSEFTPPESASVKASTDAEFPIEIAAKSACPRYLGRVIQGVNLSAESPIWLQERLRRSGIRVIDPVVDVTNYVMLEMGQPLHAFDLDTLQEGVQVRMANAGEKLTLLDGKEVELQPDVLVIADKSKPLAMAGIMGGENSGVSESTNNILLESAFFSPSVIIGKARQYGLHTDSSMRFERGVDSELQSAAIERATELLLEIVGGEAGPVLDHTSQSDLPQRKPISLRKQRLELLIGREYESDEVSRILSGLGCEILETTSGDSGDIWKVQAPSWRFDLELEVDLIEEVARLVGYNNIEAKPIAANLQLGRSPETKLKATALVDQLVARGFREVITYSFVAPEMADSVLEPGKQVKLQNPLASDLSVMRPSLIPGLLSTVAHNLARQENRVRIFETGLRFTEDRDSKDEAGGIAQISSLSAAVCGSKYPESWSKGDEDVDFYSLKGELDSLACTSGKELEYRPQQELSYLHPGQSAEVLLDGQEIGCIGAVHPQLLKQMDIDVPVFVFEVDLEAIQTADLPGFVAPSKFPGVRRDIALLLDREITANQLIEEINSVASELLANIRLFDIYTGQGIDSNKKSVALGLTFRDSSRTLLEEEISLAVKDIVTELEQRLDAQQR